MPPGILPIEAAACGLNVLALLDATLTISNGDILQASVMNGK
jgi:hypothetical protein